MRLIAAVTLTLLSVNAPAITMEEFEQRKQAYAKYMHAKNEARTAEIEAMKPTNGIKVAFKDLRHCLDLWNGRIPYGFQEHGLTYSVKKEEKKSAVRIKGYVVDIHKVKHPYNFVCALEDDLTLDNLRTGFIIRLDEQSRSHGHKRGFFDNPDLRKFIVPGEPIPKVKLEIPEPEGKAEKSKDKLDEQ